MGRKIPKYLEKHYEVMQNHISEGRLKDAKTYLYSLSANIYDLIIERAERGSVFATILNKIESLDSCKKTNDLFKVNTHDGDENLLF